MRGFLQEDGTRGGYMANESGVIEYIETGSEDAKYIWDSLETFRHVFWNNLYEGDVLL